MRDVCKYKIPYVISFALLLIAILVIGYERCSRASIKWTYDTESCKLHYFEIFEDVLYASYPDGNLYAIDKHTGTLKWEYSDSDSSFSMCSVVDGVIYLVRKKMLLAIDSASGELIWHFNLGGYGWNPYTKPIIVNNIAYIADALKAA